MAIGLKVKFKRLNWFADTFICKSISLEKSEQTDTIAICPTDEFRQSSMLISFQFLANLSSIRAVKSKP
jgi:hypothetical protein